MREACEKHGFAGLSGFVNGVLRTITREKTKLAYPDQKREPERYLSVMTSTPLWLVQKLILEYGTESAETIFQAAFADRKTSIRLNKHRIEENGETMDSYKNRLKEAGITVEPGAYYEGAWLLSGYDFIHKIPGYKQGYFTCRMKARCVRLRQQASGQRIL